MKCKSSRIGLLVLSILLVNPFASFDVRAEEEELTGQTEEISETSTETEIEEESLSEDSETAEEQNGFSEEVNLMMEEEILTAASSQDKTPYVEYNFDNNLADVQSHSILTAWSSVNDGSNRSNATTSFGSDKTNGSYWQWHSETARGGGFYVDIDKNIGEEYTIGLKLSFENTLGGWRKIIDYKNSSVDTGFYFYNGGHLNFYNYGVNGASVTQPDQVIDMIVRRNKTTKEFEAYVVNSGTAYKDMSVTDSQDQGVPTVIDGKTRLGFFFDDIATGAEASPGGKVYNLKIWDSYMDPQDVIDALKPGGTVVAHYIDEEKDEVLPDKSVSGFIGDTYEFKAEEVFGYEYLRSEGVPATGILPDNGTKTLSFIYKCLIPYTVTARYVDEAGNKLCDDILYQGEKGKTYQLNQLEIDDYDFVRVEGEITGTYVKKPKLVTFIYKKEEIPPVLEEGTVHVSYIDETGNKLTEDAVYKGYIDDAYQTSRLTIPGYEYKQVIGNASGNYTKDPIQVKYVYAKKENEEDLGGTVLVRYLNDQGYTISSDMLFNGQIGDLYAAQRKEISKYKFDKAIGHEQGEINEGIQTVTLVYVPLASNVLARYVDRSDITIADAEIYSGGIGHSYQTQKKEIDGYRLVKIEGKESGVFSEEVQVVKYMYGLIGNVRVNYLDLDGNSIHDPLVYTEFIDEDYQTKPLEIYSYELVRTEGNESGKFQVQDQIVNYIYEKIVVGNVHIHTLDESGNKIVEDRLMFGRVGRDYAIEVPEYHGYELIKTEGNLKGTYMSEDAEVTLTYRLVMPDTVTARYVDQDGNILCQDLVYKGMIGNSYQTCQLEIKGYNFIEVQGMESGVFKREPQLVTYIYEKNQEEKPEPPEIDLDDYGQVEVQYVDEDGNEIHSSLSYMGLLGKQYKTSQLRIPGYELKEVMGESNSSYEKDVKTVTYIYVEKETEEPVGGSVIVKYETEEGITVRDDEIFDGLIGDPYQVIQYELSGYVFNRMEGPFYEPALFQMRRKARMARVSKVEANGEIEEPVKVIVMIYDPFEEEKVPASTVIAHYVDKNGNTIRFDRVFNGLVHESYQTEKAEIEGYGLLRVEGNENGIFDENVQIVTYVYDKIGKVVIKIVDEDGNVVKEEVITGFIGEEIDLKDIEIEIDGEKYIPVFPDGTKKIFGEEDQEVVIVDEKFNGKKPDVPSGVTPVEPVKAVDTADENQTAAAFTVMILSLIMAVFLKKKSEEVQ